MEAASSSSEQKSSRPAPPPFISRLRAGLRNTLRHWDPAAPTGLVPVGDAYAHLDPVLAHGLAFAVVHAGELAAALRGFADVRDAMLPNPDKE